MLAPIYLKRFQKGFFFLENELNQFIFFSATKLQSKQTVLQVIPGGLTRLQNIACVHI